MTRPRHLASFAQDTDSRSFSGRPVAHKDRCCLAVLDLPPVCCGCYIEMRAYVTALWPRPASSPARPISRPNAPGPSPMSLRPARRRDCHPRLRGRRHSDHDPPRPCPPAMYAPERHVIISTSPDPFSDHLIPQPACLSSERPLTRLSPHIACHPQCLESSPTQTALAVLAHACAQSATAVS
ncbi:hypothetical protein OH77DRAFT_1217225 [Trametes cingulata]|nr:hypothetical protein OH77DRAFT_1217225 [Trametes cingulata]